MSFVKVWVRYVLLIFVRNISSLTISLILLAVSASAQVKTGSGSATPEKADEYFKAGNYPAALKQYVQVVKNDSNNVEYRYRLGYCYLNVNSDKKKAIGHFEYVLDKKKNNVDVLFDAARAYHYGLKFDQAIKYYKLYKESGGPQKVDRLVENCNNGKMLITKPVNVKFENVGIGVNTEYPDYYPWVSVTEDILIFTSRRPSNIGGKDLDFDGLRSSDIYMATVTKGEFTKPQNLGTLVNTSLDEQAVGISPDAKQVVIYFDWIESFGDLIYTKKQGKSYIKTVPFSENVNTPEMETAGTLSPEGNILYFASKTVGGKGGSDIYISRLLPDDTWGPRENVGDPVNTSFNEDFPYLYPDVRTLYFSSDGHNSMGGYDLFKTVFDTVSKTWSKPVNLGYPINTAEDNMNISFSAVWGWNEDNTEKVLMSENAYISCWRQDSKGDLDIYRIVFPDVEPRFTLVMGSMTAKVPSGNGQFKNEPVAEADITVITEESGDIYGMFKIKNGKFLMTLQPGKYSLSVEAPGYKSHEEKIIIYDKASFVEQMSKDIVLSK